MASELFVSRIGCQTWTALRENGSLRELRVEEPEEEAPVGQIVKGRVVRILPGIQSVFVDIGLERHAYLYGSDLLLPGEGREVEPASGWMKEGVRERLRRTAPPETPVQDRLREGREILVQVEREGLRSKGPRVTCYVTLPGRYLVYLPQVAGRGISRRIAGELERARLERILDGLPVPSGGFIVRTAAEGAAESLLRADAELLVESWEMILERFDSSRAPATLHRDLELGLRALRDSGLELEAAYLDDPDLHGRATKLLETLDPALAARLRLHAGPEPLFDRYGLSEEIRRAESPRVWLRSGGYLVIEETEALVSIDVNTGKFLGKRLHQETVLKTNLEAAEEVARQLRLRDLGGIVVVDFIDMESADHRRKVQSSLEEALRGDRARTKALGLSELSLAQLTRKRSRRGTRARLTAPCPLCGGRGRIKSPRTLAGEAIPRIRRLLQASGDGAVTVRAHPDVAREVEAVLKAGGGAAGAGSLRRIRTVSDSSIAPDRVEVVGNGPD